MIKFYFSTATSSLMSHIAFEEAGVPYEPIEVSWSQKKNVSELEKVSSLGAVPVIVTPDGKAVSQNMAILQYLADQKPDTKLLGPVGSSERAQVLSWVSFVSSDFQKAFAPLNFADEVTSDEKAQSEIRKYATNNVHGYLQYIDDNLEGKEYLVGDHFTLADVAVFTLMGWCTWNEIDLSKYDNIKRYKKLIIKRPAVTKMLKAEDLLEDYQ